MLIPPAFAKQQQTDLPVDFSADEVVYDRKLSLIIARGNVEAVQGKSALKADHVTYDVKDNSMIATGNVTLTNGEAGTIHSNYAQISGNLKSGIIKQIRFVLNDKSVLLADRGETLDGNHSDFYDVAYSSCDFCLDGSRFWEIKASKLSHDKKEQNMSGQNITVHVEDVPVFYFPYFSYPDPTVKRRTGFLIPGYRSSKEMGVGVQIPFYWEISDYTDVVFNPIIAEKHNLYSGTFRQTFQYGNFDFYGTSLKDETGHRYSIDSNFLWQINDVWETQARLNKTSDDTYLRRYSIAGFNTSSPWLTSSARATALTENLHFSLEGFHYQDMRRNVNDNTLENDIPLITFFYETDRSETGDYLTYDVSAVDLSQKIGLDSKRLTAVWGWHLPDVIAGGAVFDFNATARGDVYDINDYTITPNNVYSGQKGRFHPQASVTARYPFISIDENYSQIIEPVVMGIAAPNTKNSNKIPNLDAFDFDFDDTFLFSESRLVGYDRIEPGSRINYALRWSLYGREKGQISVLFGQSYRLDDAAVFPVDSGMENKLSDYVGRVSFRPNNFLSLSYGFRLDQKSFDMRRNDVTVTAGNDLLKVGATYMYLKKPSARRNREQEEITYWAKSYLTRYWSVNYNQRINLAKNGGTTSVGAGLTYEDECFKWRFSGERDYTKDRDYNGGLTLKMYFEFKPFGGFEI